MDIERSKKLTLITLGVLAVFFIAWQAYYYYQHRGLVKADIRVLPADSTLKIDNIITAAGSVYLKPGTHHLIASRQYFDDDVKDINTKDINSRYPIYMLPAANSDKAKEWLSQHPDVQYQREAAGGSEAERQRQILLKKYPFVANLPIENLHYKIDYSTPNNQKPKLTITLYAIINGPQDYARYQQQLKSYKQEVLDYLKQNKVDLNAYQIEFVPNVP